MLLDGYSLLIEIALVSFCEVVLQSLSSSASSSSSSLFGITIENLSDRALSNEVMARLEDA